MLRGSTTGLFLFKPTTAPLLLRHVFSVSPQSRDAVTRATELANSQRGSLMDNKPFRQEFAEYAELDQSLRNLVSLRVGGAKVLAPVERPVMVQPEKSTLHYSPIRPRDSGLCQSLCASLRKLKIRKLTELQGALIPQFLRGKHVIGHAETGSGKSFGIALAACNRMLREQTTNRLHTLILVPTDALALQYERWLRHFAGSSRQIVLAAISHYPLEHQLAQLHNVQPHVMVGTPQRLSEIASLCPVIIGEKLRKKVDCIVLDEADLLLKTPITPPTEEDSRVAAKFERETLFGIQQIRGGGGGGDSIIDGGGGDYHQHHVLSCGELIDRLYRTESTELPAQIVATSATFDGETALRLNTWMRNEDVVRLTTSIEEQAVPDTLNFHFVCEKPPVYPLHTLLHLTLQHIACQVRRPKVLIFVNDEDYHVADVVRYVSGLAKFPSSTVEEDSSDDSVSAAGVGNRWKCVSLQEEDFVEKETPTTKSHQQQQEDNKKTGRRTTKTTPIQSPLASRRKIIGRNGEIFCFNDTNLSKLDVGVQANIGVATFALARGLHISGVTHVILYGDVSGSSEFLHCAGRTGRRGKVGDVVCLFTPEGGRGLKDICETLSIPWHVNRAEEFKKALVHSMNEM